MLSGCLNHVLLDVPCESIAFVFVIYHCGRDVVWVRDEVMFRKKVELLGRYRKTSEVLHLQTNASHVGEEAVLDRPILVFRLELPH